MCGKKNWTLYNCTMCTCLEPWQEHMFLQRNLSYNQKSSAQLERTLVIVRSLWFKRPLILHVVVSGQGDCRFLFLLPDMIYLVRFLTSDSFFQGYELLHQMEPFINQVWIIIQETPCTMILFFFFDFVSYPSDRYAMSHLC